MGKPTNTTAPLLLGNLLISLYIYLDKLILYFAGSYKLLKFIRQLVLTSFLFFIRVLPSFNPEEQKHVFNHSRTESHVPSCGDSSSAAATSGSDLAVVRALSQILSIINNIPVTSRKYEAIRALAEKLIDENDKVGSKTLREVNRVVLSAAFSRTLRQYEASVDEESGGNCGGEGYIGKFMHVRKVIKFAWSQVERVGKVVTRPENSAEKLAAELLWLAQKLAACGCAEEAVWRWASASNLARLSIVTEPRMQGSLLKISAFLFKQAGELGQDETDESKKEQQRQIKMDMLMSWLPFLCRANNGTEAPILSISERVELEKILEETIDELDLEEQREKVMSLWLHHFMHCPSSDWPNLQQAYVRWFNASRKLLF